jgi:transketolase
MTAAANLESDHGLRARVVSMHTLKPIDAEAIVAAGRETGAVFTVEEHSIIGGLGGAVAETLLEAGVAPRVFRRIGLPGTEFSSKVGDQDYLRAEFGLDPAGITKTIVAALAAAAKQES